MADAANARKAGDPPPLTTKIAGTDREFSFEMGAIPPPRVLREVGQEGRTELKQPLALALTAEGVLLVLDRPAPQRFRLSSFNPQGEAQGTVAEFTRGKADPELLSPVRIAVDGRQSVFVVDAAAGAVKKFTLDGRWLNTFTSAGPDGTGFQSPQDAQADRDGNVWVADTNNNRLVQLRPDGELAQVLERFASSPGGPEDDEFFEPQSLAVGPGGELAVADTNNNRVVLFDSRLRVRGPFGRAGMFEFPLQIRWSPRGDVLCVADRVNQRIQRFDLAGVRTGLVEISGNPETLSGGPIGIDGEGNVVLINPRRDTVATLAFKES